MDLIRYFATDGDLDVEEAEDLNSTGTSDDIISTDDVRLLVTINQRMKLKNIYKNASASQFMNIYI